MSTRARQNPDGPENTKATRDNQRAVFAGLQAIRMSRTVAEVQAYEELPKLKAQNQALADALRALVNEVQVHFDVHHDLDDDCGSEPSGPAWLQARAALALAQGGGK